MANFKLRIIKGGSFAIACESIAGYEDHMGREEFFENLKRVCSLNLSALYDPDKHSHLSYWFQGFSAASLQERAVLFFEESPLCRVYEADFHFLEYHDSGHVHFNLSWSYLEEIRPAFSDLLVAQR